MKRLLSAALAGLLLCTLAGCGLLSPAPQRREVAYLDLFDTVTTLVAYTDDEEEFTRTAELAHELLLEYHRLYDIYNDYEGLNNLKTVNDHAGIAPVEVDEKIIDLLQQAKEYYDLTDGRVNVAMGSVLSLWHQYREEGLADPEGAQVPPAAALEAAAEHMDIGEIVIDEAASTVYLADPELRLDVGAIAKGYATEQAALALEEAGVDSLLLSVGGNIRAIGSPQGEDSAWRIGVQDPAGTAQDYLWALDLTGASLVTSGSYQRYYTVDGVRYHHIIDPETLFPADYFDSVTIYTRDSALADALSTALFCLPYEEGLALVESLEGTEALWVGTDGTVRTSGGFPENLLG